MANGKYDAADLSGSNYGGLKISNTQETFNKDSKDARIAELEAQLKTAKRDGIIDFAKSKEFTEIFDDGFAASHAAISAYRYANSLTGED